MKLFMKRDLSDPTARFVVFDESGNEKYIVKGRQRTSCLILDVCTSDECSVAEIIHYTLIVNHFSVRYGKRQLSIVPQFDHGFAMLMFGSSLSFSSSALMDSFRLSDVDRSTVMTMERRVSSGGLYYELDIKNAHYEMLSVCVAVCVSLYLVSRQAQEKNSKHRTPAQVKTVPHRGE